MHIILSMFEKNFEEKIGKRSFERTEEAESGKADSLVVGEKSRILSPNPSFKMVLCDLRILRGQHTSFCVRDTTR